MTDAIIDSPFTQAALVLAEKGMFVFPCKTDKSPLTPNGHIDASNDPNIIRSWGERWPDAAVGINCETSAFVVVDEDRKNAVDAWLKRHGLDFPETVISITASGGRHFYFGAKEGMIYKGKLCEDVDIKHKGYVIAPPSKCFSRRAGSIGKYRWDERYANFADAPIWLERDHVAVFDTPASACDLVKQLLTFIDADATYNTWVWVLMNVFAATGGSNEGLELADRWAQTGSKYKTDDVRRRWHGFDAKLAAGVPVLASLASYQGADLTEIAARHGHKGAAGLLKGQRAAPFGGTKITNRPDKVSELLSIAEEADLFHTTNGDVFADIWVNGHRETWPVNSSGFRAWITRELFQRKHQSASPEALKTALDLCIAQGRFDGEERRVFYRTGELDSVIYLDLADTSWQSIEMDQNGWRIVPLPPVRFRRTDQTEALPQPSKGGSIEKLRSVVNVASDCDFVLLVGWLLQALLPQGPYPPMMVSGEQGSAKSTFAEILRAIIDPHEIALRTLPSNEQDLFLAAKNGHLLAFDNLSGISSKMSDALCRLATGGAFATRKLYTDDEEATLKAENPMILNGIGAFAVRPDLIDRSVFVTLSRIGEGKRRLKREIMSAFEALHPEILGALLDAVVTGLQRRDAVKLDELPRMADCCLWVTACETHFWKEGTFIKALQEARKIATEDATDVDPVAAAIRKMMDSRTDWTGTASNLLEALFEFSTDESRRMTMWPRTPGDLGKKIERCAPALRELGLEITKSRSADAKRDRIIQIKKLPSKLSSPSSDKTAASSSMSETLADDFQSWD